MTEIGKIVKVKEGDASVRFFRKGECDRCRVCSVVKDGAQVELTVKNSLDLNVGDFVKVEVYSKRVFRASALIYLIPLVLTALCAGLGSLASIPASVILAILGLIVGLAFALPIDICVLRKNVGYKPRMVESVCEVDYLNAKPKTEID